MAPQTCALGSCGKAAPVFRKALAEAGIRIQDGGTNAETAPQADYLVNVTVNYDIRARRVLDADADRLQLTVSIEVRSARDDRVLKTIAPKSLAKNYFIPKRMDEDAVKYFEQAAAETVKSLQH